MPRTSIETEIRNGLKTLQELHQQRAKIDEAIAQLEAIFGKAALPAAKTVKKRKAACSGAERGRETRRLGGGKPLGEYVHEVLSATQKGLTLKQIEERVLAAGYPTTAKSIYNQIMAVVSKGFKRVERGVYSGRKAVRRWQEGSLVPASRRRKRGTFSETAEQFILGQLKSGTMTTASVNKAWKEAGRGGTANVTLGRLVKAKKIKASPVKGARGSEYSLA